MKKFIYYPYFEPPNQEWLKFALLYLENFESIVPYERQHLVSDEFHRIRDETDLVDLYSPDFQLTDLATTRTIDEALKILSRRQMQTSLFNRVNIYRNWQDPLNWTFQIYGEKFTHDLVSFCLENGFGQQNNDGLLLPRELAFIFMTHLAKEISFVRNGSIITDNVQFDNYTNYSRTLTPKNLHRNKFMSGVLNLTLPTNISNISIPKLIEFRNKNRERISEFNTQLDLIEDSISHGLSEREFVDSFNDAHKELIRQIGILGAGSMILPVSAYFLIQNKEALQNEDYLSWITTALGISIRGFFAVRKALIDTHSKRSCKKYLTNLAVLS